MQSMNPFISNELFSWMSIWSHELYWCLTLEAKKKKKKRRRGGEASVLVRPYSRLDLHASFYF